MSTPTNSIVDSPHRWDDLVEIDQQMHPAQRRIPRYVDRASTTAAVLSHVTPDNQPNDTIRIAVIQGGLAEWDNYPRHEVAGIPLERTTMTGLKHLDGTISMARMTPDSANSEFFICVGDQPELDFGGRRNPDGQGFAAFGQVVEGMDVVHAINTSPQEGQGLKPPIEIMSAARRG